MSAMRGSASRVKASAPKMSKDEMKWCAQDDARTLAEAEVIKADPERLKRAQAAAKSMADEAEVKADAMEKIASGEIAPQRVRGKAS